MSKTVSLGPGRVIIDGIEYPCVSFELLIRSMNRCAQAAAGAADAAGALLAAFDEIEPPGPVSRKELDDLLAASRTSPLPPALPPKKRRAQWKLDPRARYGR